MQESKCRQVSGEDCPCGVRSEQADAAIIMDDCPYSFGCVGCERSELMVKYLIKRRGIPTLHVRYPSTDEEAVSFVAMAKEFLEGLN